MVMNNRFIEQLHNVLKASIIPFLFTLPLIFSTCYDESIKGPFQASGIKSWSGGFGIPVKVGGSTADISYTYSDMAVFKNVSRMSITFSF